jgi:hypothetical protein
MVVANVMLKSRGHVCPNEIPEVHIGFIFIYIRYRPHTNFASVYCDWSTQNKYIFFLYICKR